MVTEVKGTVAALVVLALMGATLAVAGITSAAGTRDLTPAVEQGTTDRFGGGDYISVRAGDARLGVVYGTPAHRNSLYVFAEYTRYLGGAEVYDAQGNLLRRTGIPVYTVFGQSFDSFIEYQERDNVSIDPYGLLNLYRFDRNDTTGDAPQKMIQLAYRAWTATAPTTEASGNTTWVNFTVSTDHLPYTLVWQGGMPRMGRPSDGFLDHLAFTFHLKVDVHDIAGQVPWWKVSVSDGTPRTVTGVEYLGTREYAGQAVAMGAKYDHRIEGWDFASAGNRLALETRAFIANFVSDAVSRFIHRGYRTEARGDNYTQNDTNLTALRPTLLRRDYVYFNDDWQRVGRLVWSSDVTVDGQPGTVYFQVQGGSLFSASRNGNVFVGFAIRGAYIYPAGAVIVHDPGMEATSELWSLPSGVNLTPTLVLALQALVASIAIVPAVLLRARKRLGK